MRPLRNSDPSLFRLISIRTAEARLWMIPSANLKKLHGGILARYQEIFEIEIYAYFFLTNHIHLLIRAPKGNADEFLENVHREIARRMNFKLRREGRFWGRRYDDIPVGNESDLEEAFLYVSTQATRHHLLEDASEWPGLHSFNHSIKETDRTFTFYHYSAEEGEPKSTTHTLKLSILPTLESLTQSERKTLVKKLLNERLDQLRTDRKAEGKGFLGIKKLIGQSEGDVPSNVSKGRRPHCYSKCKETWLKLRTLLRARIAQYKEASFYYRQGLNDVKFPEFSFMPPLHRLPRLLPFKPIAKAA